MLVIIIGLVVADPGWHVVGVVVAVERGGIVVVAVNRGVVVRRLHYQMEMATEMTGNFVVGSSTYVRSRSGDICSYHPQNGAPRAAPRTGAKGHNRLIMH